MRAFLAISLPQNIQNEITGIQSRLQKTGAKFTWVRARNIHLTLKFIGEIDNKQLADISASLDKVAADNTEFAIEISSLGAFPNIDSPRIIWLGLDKGDTETRKIALSLENALSRLGIPKEDREFSSHITIGRLKSPVKKSELVKELNNLSGDFKTKWGFWATKITLYKSTLTAQGPIYEVLKEANLTTS